MKTPERDNSQERAPVPAEQLFAQLHEATWPVLFPFACRKLGGPDEAYDVLRELFIELWDKRDVFSPA